MRGRSRADIALFSVTIVEVVRLIAMEASRMDATYVVYVFQHLLVALVAFTRLRPKRLDTRGWTLVACAASYAHAYGLAIVWAVQQPQPLWAPGRWIVDASAVFTLWSLITLRFSFGIRPALRTLVENGPYRLVRHPIYASYFLGDVGLVLAGFSPSILLLLLGGWCLLLLRLRLEEDVLQYDAGWARYASRVPYRLVPGLY